MSASSGSQQIPTFVSKLLAMVDDPKINDILSWDSV